MSKNIQCFLFLLPQGLALVDRGSGPDTICLLRVEDLSEDTLERFNHLFTLREKWTEADITPYIQLVLLDKMLIDSCYTRQVLSSEALINTFVIRTTMKSLLATRWNQRTAKLQPLEFSSFTQNLCSLHAVSS